MQFFLARPVIISQSDCWLSSRSVQERRHLQSAGSSAGGFAIFVVVVDRRGATGVGGRVGRVRHRRRVVAAAGVSDFNTDPGLWTRVSSTTDGLRARPCVYGRDDGTWSSIRTQVSIKPGCLRTRGPYLIARVRSTDPAG